MDLGKRIKLVSFALGVAVTSSVYAKDARVVMPNCLERTLSIPHKVLAFSKELSLVSIADNQIEQLAEQAHKVKCGKFINVSHNKNAVNNPGDFLSQLHSPKTLKTISQRKYEIKHQDIVKPMLEKVDPSNIMETLGRLTSFCVKGKMPTCNRYSKGQLGLEAAIWIKRHFEELAAGRTDTATTVVETDDPNDKKGYIQPSIVTVVGKDLPGPAVVLGAHMDTLNGHKPGADDDGSGSASLMEAARVILQSKELKLDHPVYFIWYSAEEMGLIGSQRVVDYFDQKNIDVKTVIQFDMTGYRYKGSDKMWVIRDNVHDNLSNYVEELIKGYIGVKVGQLKCHYGCSDHASWYQYSNNHPEKKIDVAAPFESDFKNHNPYIHSAYDVIGNINEYHMANYSKLAVAFAVELALD